MNIKDMQKAAWENATNKGFHTLPPKKFYRMAALIGTEVSEMVDAYEKMKGLEAIAKEMADIVIRVGDLAEDLGVDLDQAVVDKMEYNKTRPYLHGGRQ